MARWCTGIFFTAFFLLLPFCITAVAEEALTGTIKACDDSMEWPPFIYYEREGDSVGQMTGVSVEVVRKVLEKEGLKLQIALVPWQRCLEQTESGSRDMVLNSPFSPTRAARFLLSKAYYQATPCYIYSSNNHPLGLGVSKREDLWRYKGCGISGRDYSLYHIPTSKIDTTSPDMTVALKKLHDKRCDYIPMPYETFAGYSLINDMRMADPALAQAPVPDMPALEYHILLPKTERGEKLKALLDRGLDELAASNELHEILVRYKVE